MVARTISPLISRSISRAINELEGAAFNPIALFAAGEQGVWYDPSDLSTLFQDSSGTIPVTAAGQPVGMMRDKSGRGNHATQATATSRPILQTTDGKWYLAFDGVDDFLVTGNINLSANNKITVFNGLTKLSDALAGIVYEFSATVASNNGTFVLLAPASNGAQNYTFASRGTTLGGNTSYGRPAPDKVVITNTADISAPKMSTRINTTVTANSVSSQGTGNYGVWPLYIGSRGGISTAFNGHLYSLIIRGAASSDKQITDAESYVNSKTGAY